MRKITLCALGALCFFLLGFVQARSQVDRLVGVVHGFLQLYEQTTDLKSLSTNQRIQFRELKQEMDRLYRETKE